MKGLGRIEVDWVVESAAVGKVVWGGDRQGPDSAGRGRVRRRLMKGLDHQN